jgi:hypothetical protein
MKLCHQIGMTNSTACESRNFRDEFVTNVKNGIGGFAAQKAGKGVRRLRSEVKARARRFLHYNRSD